MNPAQKLQLRLKSLWRESAAPGMGAALRLNGDLIWSGAEGLADRDEKRPMPIGATVPIYSVTKTFTAAVVLALERENSLSLNSRVIDFFPELKLPASLTASHLLQHTGGLRDYYGLRSYHEAVKKSPFGPWSDAEFFAATLPEGLLFSPGTGWAYSNIGYLLLRRIVEKITRLTLGNCIRKYVTSPLGLRDTFSAETIEDWQRCVPGYGTEVSDHNEMIDVRGQYHPGWCAPGVAVSTPEEITLFFDRLFSGNLLSAPQLQAMCHLVDVPGNHPPAVRPSYGLGIMADPGNPLGSWYAHGGSGPGYGFYASILPEFSSGRLSLAVFGNRSGFPTHLLERALLTTACELLRS